MYEQIMKGGNSDMFATLFNEIFPVNRRSSINKMGLLGNEVPEIVNENEWLQEYYIIYMSYILDHKESQQYDEE